MERIHHIRNILLFAFSFTHLGTSLDRVFGSIVLCLLIAAAIVVFTVVGVVLLISWKCKNHHRSQQNMRGTKIAPRQDKAAPNFNLYSDQPKADGQRQQGCRDSTMIPNEAYNFNFFFLNALLNSPVADYEVAVASKSKADNADSNQEEPEDDDGYIDMRPGR